MDTMSREDRWKAVLARDKSLDGAFVYAVRSTGIYCRPSCPARRPRQDLVSFFRTPEAARQAGFLPLPPLPAGRGGESGLANEPGPTSLPLH